MRTYKLFPLVLLFVVSLSLVSAPPALAQGGVSCTSQTLEVTLFPGDPTQYTLYGELCSLGSLTGGEVVQVLVHGATYNHSYWDFQGYQPEHYSYVQRAAVRGYVTFNIDRLGSGSSDAPDGFLVNVDTSAYVLHQVVQALRGGTFGTAFGSVMLVGHSFGSLISVAEAVQYQDVDGVVLTGFAHNINPDFLAVANTSLYPAEFDPQFAGSGLVNYFTTIPGTRAMLFYNADFAAPNVIAYDEANKDVVSLGLLLDQGRFFSPESLGISVPVYLILGDSDFLFCGGGIDCSDPANLASYEASFFSPAACLQTEIVAQAGHTLNLHYNAGQTFSQVLNWSDAYVASEQGCQ